MNSVIDQKAQNNELLTLTYEDAVEIVKNKLEKAIDGYYVHNFPTEQESERIKRAILIIQGKCISI